MHAADILGIRAQVERLLLVQQEKPTATIQSEEELFLESSTVRKILRAVLEVRQACDKIALELAYTTDIMQREEKHEEFVYELFNLANFAQLSTFYTLEPFVRMHKQFVMSAIFTTTSGSLGTGFATLSKLYGRTAKASNVTPPPILGTLVTGSPVDTTGMPPIITRFLDYKDPISNQSRREQLFASWKRRYNVDASDGKNLCSIADKNRASLRLLKTRVLLLWSLHTLVQEFDYQLLSLLNLLKDPVLQNTSLVKATSPPAKYTDKIAEALRILKIEPQVAELISSQEKNIDDIRRDELELLVLKRTLQCSLEIQVASGKVDEELFYNYHIVLAGLLASRAKWLQYNYDLNFLQTGIMGVTAGRLYLSRFTYAGDKQFVIAGGIGCGLTSLALLQMHGFWRRVDADPNSLANVLILPPSDEWESSILVSTFMNSPPPGSTNGKTRKQLLIEGWQKSHVTTLNLRSKRLSRLLLTYPHISTTQSA